MMAYAFLVDGRFGDWSDWVTCSVTCGNGTQNRRRQCIPPQHGGQPCIGHTVETQECFVRFCPGMNNAAAITLQPPSPVAR